MARRRYIRRTGGRGSIENVILFTRLCERPSDELRRAGVKLETNTLAYSGLFYFIGNSEFWKHKKEQEFTEHMLDKLLSGDNDKTD